MWFTDDECRFIVAMHAEMRGHSGWEADHEEMAHKVGNDLRLDGVRTWNRLIERGAIVDWDCFPPHVLHTVQTQLDRLCQRNDRLRKNVEAAVDELSDRHRLFLVLAVKCGDGTKFSKSDIGRRLHFEDQETQDVVGTLAHIGAFMLAFASDEQSISSKGRELARKWEHELVKGLNRNQQHALLASALGAAKSGVFYHSGSGKTVTNPEGMDDNTLRGGLVAAYRAGLLSAFNSLFGALTDSGAEVARRIQLFIDAEDSAKHIVSENTAAAHKLESISVLETPDQIVQHMENPSSRRVFIVHGHDSGLKHAVARYVELLGLNSLILEEQPNRGKTIIEKFETYSDCGYAIVLATGDDLAASVKELAKKGGATTDESLAARARQNVVFELGYFVGKLGRGRVALIASSDVELPGDLDGVVYISRGSWTGSVWRELRAAGFEFSVPQIDAATAMVA